VYGLASRIVAGDGSRGLTSARWSTRKLKWVTSQVEDAAAKGAKVLTGGKRIGQKGYFFGPTVLADCTPEMEVMREETFGPVLAFMKVGDDLDKAFSLSNDTVFGLSAYFFSRDARNCYLAGQRMEAGSIWVNDIHGSFVQAPYGGMKMSGIGREQGSIAVDDYLSGRRSAGDELNRGALVCVSTNRVGLPDA
jgi:succinate-semialdehyde dehydrogenase/glutarate-semialdehyde dehydrogenase